MVDDCCSSKESELARIARWGQRRVLKAALTINAAMFVLEFVGGFLAGSAALMADSVDMLADAFVYGLSIAALNRGARWKAAAAVSKGGLILLFGIGVLIEVGFKISSGVPPSSGLMLAFAGIALAANLTCLGLLWRFRALDINMASTFECSRNDVAANVGVLAAAGLVAWLHSPWPDILVACAIAVVFLRSAASVLARAIPQLRAA